MFKIRIMEYNINTYINNSDNTCRFVLGYDNHNPLIVMGVNPSTANNVQPDATMRRVLGYAERNKFDGFLMINVYPVRSTNPQDLPQNMDCGIHNQNLQYITDLFKKHSQATILVAFGNAIEEIKYLNKCFLDIIKQSQQFNLRWKQIGDLTVKGNPRHPSRGAYLPLNNFDLTKYLNRHK